MHHCLIQCAQMGEQSLKIQLSSARKASLIFTGRAFEHWSASKDVKARCMGFGRITSQNQGFRHSVKWWQILLKLGTNSSCYINVVKDLLNSVIARLVDLVVKYGRLGLEDPRWTYWGTGFGLRVCLMQNRKLESSRIGPSNLLFSMTHEASQY